MSLPPSDMPPLCFKVLANLPELVRTTFSKARASGDVNFYPTKVAVFDVNSVPFQLRFAPSLANKPKNPPHSSSSEQSLPKKAPFDPFDNPPAPLLITTPSALDSHFLVLNKFAIVPEHFILATRAFAPQTHLLDAADLRAAYACIDAYHRAKNNNVHKKKDDNGEIIREDTGGELFVFFNSGPASGASQPHRHLQLLPVQRMRDGLPDDGGHGWDVLANALLDKSTRERLPFQTFAERIDPALGADGLRTVYLALYRLACGAVLGTAAERTSQQEEGEARISYNLAMTRDSMVIVPRATEGGDVFAPPASGDGDNNAEREKVGQLAFNGTLLAGTALVKSQVEWDALRQDPGQLAAVLGRIGVPWETAPGGTQGRGKI
ncbi:histidine triad-like protein [Podospora didyma]|uniref:Histidine triad-like protein n=1 Tax=Podospora didyma TaxID=330526 RepID=A0AAE0K341_9PEZI|nr:histidine triad-like protein [Podospora didyma]